MDKRVIFAVAGSGKTTHIVENLSTDKRSLIVTYTTNNYENLRRKITSHFNGSWPKNVTLLTYYSYLYGFCYKPFLADQIRARGVLFDQKIVSTEQAYKRTASASRNTFYMTSGRYFYNNRLAFFIKNHVMDEVKDRTIKYFDEFIIDEIQDIAGRDFDFLESLMETDINMLFVGDFYQHTFDTSRDGNVNKPLYNDRAAYEARFTRKGFVPDNTTLTNSWRCSQNVCEYIRDNLGIAIYSHRTDADNTPIEYITDTRQIAAILEDKQIIKLHYQNGARAGLCHKNWGDSKGEDHHQDVCVLLNGTTACKRTAGKLNELAASTKNKLYVALTRARGNVFLVDE